LNPAGARKRKCLGISGFRGENLLKQRESQKNPTPENQDRRILKLTSQKGVQIQGEEGGLRSLDYLSKENYDKISTTLEKRLRNKNGSILNIVFTSVNLEEWEVKR